MFKQFTKPKSYFWFFTLVIILVVLGIFLVYPFIAALSKSFYSTSSGKLSLENFRTFVVKSYYYQALLNSLKLSFFSMLIAAVLGSALAYFMQMYQIKGKSLIEMLIIISMLSPPFLGAYAWILLFGNNGFLTHYFQLWFNKTPQLYGFNGLLTIFSLKLYPLVYLYLSGALKKLDYSLLEAASSLGSPPWKRNITMLFPLLLPTLLAAILMVFTNTLTDFGTPMLIGQGFNVVPVQIYSEFVGESGGSANFAATLALILVLITTFLFYLQNRILSRRSYLMSSLKPIPQQPLTKGYFRVLVYGFIIVLLLLSLLPQIVIIFSSFLKVSYGNFTNQFSLENYHGILKSHGSTIANSLGFGLAAGIIITLLSLFISYIVVRIKSPAARFIDACTMLPYVIPGPVVGIALLLGFNKPPLILSGTVFIMIICFVLRSLPYTLRSSVAILQQIQPSIEEAAISLGANHYKAFFTVTTPVMLVGVISGAVLSYVDILNELSASIILFTPYTKTLSLAIYGDIIQSTYGRAAALASLLTLLTVVSLLIFNKFKTKDTLTF